MLRALAARCRNDPIALRTLLQALMPGLVQLACRVEQGGEDVAGELVSLAWCRLATGAYDRRPGQVAANVLLDVRKYYVPTTNASEPRRTAPGAHLGRPAASSVGAGRTPCPLDDEHVDLPLRRQGAVFVHGAEWGPSPEETVDDRDVVFRLFRGRRSRR